MHFQIFAIQSIWNTQTYLNEFLRTKLLKVKKKKKRNEKLSVQFSTRN